MHQLRGPELDNVRPLTEGVSLACAVDATLDGTCPGTAWADDPARPTAALVDTAEGHYVLGTPHESFCRALTDFVTATLDPGGRGERWWWFYLRCPSGEWAEAMRETLPEETTVEKPREFYLRERGSFDGRNKVPSGFSLVRVDDKLLARDDLDGIDRIRRQAQGNFGSPDRFLERGFSFCMLHEGTIVSACSSDNVSGGRCEVGIYTAAAYRRQGLGTLTAAAAVDWALSHGSDQVGWHCLRYNLASAATARKVGFRKAADYVAFLVCRFPADAHAVRGNLALIRGEFSAAADQYQEALRATASGEQSASYLLGQPKDRARYAFQAACAHTLSEHPAAAANTLAKAIEAAGYRQGGY